ncbi:MAG: hypothetical protein CMO19_03535 [Thaumarchaeota archaeon]|nr:hypothetical protein [Nitrososphaerota archaeon]|tara:strand:- start:1162 stop:1563 length:402 start_codon:yes stop_codon:yes gene_type:complete
MSVSYWRNRDRYFRIIGSVCNSCNYESFPNFYKCKKCNSEDISDKQMPHKGKLISYTLSSESMPGFEKELPMSIGLIRLDNNVNIVAQIVDSDIEDIKINANVKAVFRKISSDGDSGQIYYGYKFKIIKNVKK